MRLPRLPRLPGRPGGRGGAAARGEGTTAAAPVCVRVGKPGIDPAPEDAEFTFEGETIRARCGESVAAALVAAGKLACRSTRATGERGIFCGMGVCTDCSLTIDGRGGRLACMEKVVSGLRVAKDPAMRALDQAEPAAPDLPEDELEADVVIVGAGPAGLAAALAASSASASVLLVDNRRTGGGQYFKQPGEGFSLDDAALDAQYRAGRALLGRVAASPVRALRETVVWGATGPGHLHATSPTRRYAIRGHALVLATGAYERGVPFPGWTLPGVMTTGAAQTLLRSYLVAAGRRVLVSGNGPLNLQVAAELRSAGVDVVAVAETAPLFRLAAALHLVGLLASSPRDAHQGLGYLRDLAGVELLARSAVVAAGGDGRVEWAEVVRLDPDGRPIDAGRRRFRVDSVCVGHGFVPSVELARALGCAQAVDARTGTVTVLRDRRGRTSVQRVWSAGDGGRVAGAQAAQAMGTLAGIDAARSVGHVASGTAGKERRLAHELARHERFQRSLWRLFDGPRLVDQLASSSTVVCRCEEVTLGQLTAAGSSWSASAGALKRLTRAGMGKCQGRYCGPVLAEIARRVSGEPLGTRSGFAPQAPCLPAPLATLAAMPSAGHAEGSDAAPEAALTTSTP